MRFKNTKKGDSMEIEELESLDTAFEAKNQKGGAKKYYTLFLSQATMSELEQYLKEFGHFKENKSTFIQEALEEHLKRKREHIKQDLSEKLKKLQD
ncbi:hypothetical protein [Helicobacter suis]|uniref:hypothetical protein n=1 Tax=Helicobacter suis TaxID=104628 RepID=UPI0013D5CD13|nr:hypothetical protein [Helicobacter suis]